MIEKIEILQHRESCDFGCHSGEKAWWLLGIVAYHHQMVVQLGEYRLNSLSVPLVSPQGRPPVLLVQPVRNFKCDVCRGKQALVFLLKLSGGRVSFDCRKKWGKILSVQKKGLLLHTIYDRSVAQLV